jgi:hypothetical protein
MVMAAAGLLVPHQQIEQPQDDDSKTTAQCQNFEVSDEIGIDSPAGDKVAHDAADHEKHHGLQHCKKPARPLCILVCLMIMPVRTAGSVNVLVSMRTMGTMNVLVLMPVGALVRVDVFMPVTAFRGVFVTVFMRTLFRLVRVVVTAAPVAIVMMIVIVFVGMVSLHGGD